MEHPRNINNKGKPQLKTFPYLETYSVVITPFAKVPKNIDF
jgi:hypothetical protein